MAKMKIDEEIGCVKCFFYVPRFSDNRPGRNVGDCHRYPPIQDGAGKNTIDTPPSVYGDGWCGEWKAKAL